MTKNIEYGVGIMTGKTHKAVGVCIGIAFTYWGIKTYGSPVFAISSVAAAAGAMLPDIDHNNSKIGSRRKAVVDIAAKILYVMFVFVILALCAALVFVESYGQIIRLLLMIVIPIVILSIIARAPFIKSTLKFATRHRGIMHTMIVPLILSYGFVKLQNEIIGITLLAVASGYTSHLILDCFTKRGCPVLWPFIRSNISVLPIRTGSNWEYVFSSAFAVCVLFLTFFFL